jgi:hypothetical protein
MTDLPRATPERTLPLPEPDLYSIARPESPRTPQAPGEPGEQGERTGSGFGPNSPRTALVVLAGIGALALAFIIMVFAGINTESINALAVIATPIASMVAAYYGITLSIQQVKNERAEKDRAIARMEAADASSRETEVWAAQMESGLRVAMAKLNAVRVDTDEVTKAAGTPEGFF